ncbi:MAG TPA: glycosyltransferase family 39 protein [Solirubrobacterales bacterium]|nr:glycosyltransferase family 39 protein [Solirubrobacterales bacterium]
MALALLVRVATIAADSGYHPQQDAWDYDRHARSIADGDGFPDSYYVVDRGPSALRAPGYPFFLGGLYAVSGDSIAVGRLANAALGALAVFLLYLIAKRIWGRRIGLLAAALVAVFPPLVLLSRELLSEPLFIALELGMVLCLLEFRRLRQLRWAALGGLLFGLAALTRNPGPALAIPLVVGLWVSRPRLRWRAAAAPALALLCAALTIAPWTLRNAVEFGRFIPLTSGTGFAMAGTYNNASLEDTADPGSWRTPRVAPEYTPLFATAGIDEGTLDATLRGRATAFALDHPLYVAEVTGWNLLRLFEVTGGSVVDPISGRVEIRGIGSANPPAERIGLGLAILLALVGVAAVVRSRRPQLRRIPTGPLFLWLVPILLILVAAPINGLPRQRTPVDPFILILAAIGVAWAWDRLRVGRVSPA